MPDQPRPTRVVGLGCQRGCPTEVLLELIERSLSEHQLTIDDISALASIDLKHDEPGLLQLAGHLHLPLVFFSAAQLAAHDRQLTHRSAIAFAHTGCHGVAESAALALASQSGASPAQLLIPRQNNAQATFALAIALPDSR